GIRDHQQDFVSHLLARIAPALEQIERLQTILAFDYFKTQWGQGFTHQIAGRAGVIDDEPLATLHLRQYGQVQHLFRDPDVVGDDLGQHLLHVDDLDDLVDAIFGYPGNGRQIVRPSGGARGWQNILPGHVDDVGYLPHQ